MGKREFRISPSRLSTWGTCHLAYFYQYIEHAKAVKSLPLIFGGEIHHMLEEFYKKNFKSPESFANSFGYRWRLSIAGDFLKGKQKKQLNQKSILWTPKRNSENESVEFLVGDHTRLFFIEDEKELLKLFFQYSRMGKSLLANFYQRHKGQNPPDEKEFRISFDFRGYPLLGVIDRIDRVDGEIFITDYKTDRYPPASQNVLDSNHQLTLYSAAFRSHFGENESALLYYLVRGDKVYRTTRVDQKPFDDLEKKCEGLMKGVQAGDFPPKYGYHCGFCNYLKPCSGNKQSGELFDEDSIFDSSVFGDNEA